MLPTICVLSNRSFILFVIFLGFSCVSSAAHIHQNKKYKRNTNLAENNINININSSNREEKSLLALSLKRPQMIRVNNRKIAGHKKRCHYTDNLDTSNNTDTDNLAQVSYSFIKQQHVRDQNRHMINNHHHHHKNGLMDQSEQAEQLLVNIGDTINLTCNIQTKEIDWHFKDKNLTTTILSYGLQLQVASQSAQYEETFNSFKPGEYDDFQTKQDVSLNAGQQIVKYRVSSDRQSTHMLTVHVQGNQDEGSYQCVDSKSEIPVKKTIRVILSKIN
jgi:hypothetical protein